MKFNDFNIPWGNGIFRRTKRITFALSNLCNMAHVHNICPSYHKKDSVFLPESIIRSVLITCKKFEFRGIFSFHLYNEPLLDPRLVYFMRQIKTELPMSAIFIVTNGWYLDQNILEDLVAGGMDFISITAYSEEEYKKFNQLKTTIPFRILKAHFDDRLKWYHNCREQRTTMPCFAPLYEICIACTGKMILCPYDWKERNIIGDLNENTLEEILSQKKTWSVFESLSNGIRQQLPCKNCRTQRGEPYSIDPIVA